MTDGHGGSPAHRAGLPPVGTYRSSGHRAGRRSPRPFAFVVALILLEVVVIAVVQSMAVLVLGSRGTGAVTGTATRVAPSGLSAPIGDLPGWRQTFVDEFDGTALGPEWGAYSGVPMGDPVSLWNPSQVIVENSTLILRAEEMNGRWVTGGVSNHPVAQTYGRWEVRFRADASDEIPMAFLLWPQGGDWPPEIDFFEDVGGDRREASAFLHFRTDGDSGRDKDHRGLVGDFTTWHTLGLEWSPGRVRLLLDGAAWAEFDGTTVPAQPMWLALQAQSGGCERRLEYDTQPCPVVGTPAVTDIELVWVAVWEPAT